MIANRIVEIIVGITAIILIPFQIVTTFVLGILVRLTFGLLLIPFSLIWIILFFGPLLGLSYTYEKVSFMRVPISIIGIPIAVLGDCYCALLPSMGEKESRVSKLLLCNVFPYTWHLSHFIKTDERIKYSKGYSYLLEVFKRIPYKDKITRDYVIKLKAENEIASRLNS